MEQNLRTFVAIKIDTGDLLREQFREFKSLFRGERINWVSEDNFHLTLRFLGNTRQDQLPGLFTALKTVATATQPFSFSIAGAGYFKSKGNPQVLFVKIAESASLKALATQVEKAVVEAGFPREEKDFRPHLTLGRIKYLNSRTRFCSILDEMAQVSYQEVQVDDFIFYQSILRPEGPSYKSIQKFRLA